MSLTRKFIAFGTSAVPQTMMYRRRRIISLPRFSNFSLYDVTEAYPCHSPTLHKVTWQYRNRKWRVGSWCDVRTLAVFFSLFFSCLILCLNSLALFAWQVNIYLPVYVYGSRAVIWGGDWVGTNLSSLRTIKHYEFYPNSAFFFLFPSFCSLSLSLSLCLSLCSCRYFYFIYYRYSVMFVDAQSSTLT
jgi:hypothetical protein